VRDQTRRRVLATIEKLDYQLPRSTSKPGSGRARSVGIVIKEIGNPFYSEIHLAARGLLAEAGYAVFEASSEGTYREEGRVLEALREQGAAGAIVAPVLESTSDLSHLFLAHRKGMPLVLLGEVRGLPAPCVSVDNVEAEKAAVRYLLEGGHERILHVSGPSYSLHSQNRVAGVKEAFSESPLQFRSDMVVEGGASMEDGYRVVYEAFSSGGDLPTAVTCFNDLVAIGALRALSELGLSVPGDVSVVGYDDIEIAAYLPTPLTTVHVPSKEMGRRSAELLLQQLRGETSEAPMRVVLDAELVIRGTSRTLL
jgi:DNA-binding LacI/PurR family transcriptional regulator